MSAADLAVYADLLRLFHRAAVRANASYFLYGGTLLGWVGEGFCALGWEEGRKDNSNCSSNNSNSNSNGRNFVILGNNSIQNNRIMKKKAARTT